MKITLFNLLKKHRKSVTWFQCNMVLLGYYDTICNDLRKMLITSVILNRKN
jgi:hypothetical protein